MVCNEHVIIFKDNMTVTYSGISRPAPAAGRCKFVVQSRQAQLVTSLGTLPQAGLCCGSLALLILLQPPGGPVSTAVLGWGVCVLLAGPGVLPSFLTPFS